MNLLLGIRVDSPLARLDVRVKLAWLGLNWALLLAHRELYSLTLVSAAVMLSSLGGRLPLKSYLPLIKVGLIVALQLSLLQGLLRTQGTVWFSLGGLQVYGGGLQAGLYGAWLLTVLGLLCLQFIMWTTPLELSLFLVKCRVPARAAVGVGLTLRFMPLVEKDLREIVEAQQMRGIELKGPWRKVRHLLSLVLPLLMRTLRRAQAVSLAMELKAFGLAPRRTWPRELRLGRADLWALGLLAVYGGLVFGLCLYYSEGSFEDSTRRTFWINSLGR